MLWDVKKAHSSLLKCWLWRLWYPATIRSTVWREKSNLKPRYLMASCVFFLLHVLRSISLIIADVAGLVSLCVYTGIIQLGRTWKIFIFQFCLHAPAAGAHRAFAFIAVAPADRIGGAFTFVWVIAISNATNIISDIRCLKESRITKGRISKPFCCTDSILCSSRSYKLCENVRFFDTRNRRKLFALRSGKSRIIVCFGFSVNESCLGTVTQLSPNVFFFYREKIMT